KVSTWKSNVGSNIKLPPNSLTPFVAPVETTTYRLTAADSLGCFRTDFVTVTVDKSRDLYAPTAFSPNGDGINDFFLPQPGPNVANIRSMNIYSRWGSLIYTGTNLDLNNPNSGWNGKVGTEDVPVGTYVYAMEVEFKDGEVVIVQGDVALIR
ncbi:MAG: gliding motility-associated C-terminal domain-containing protein, partial [Bacteroidota bacterium]